MENEQYMQRCYDLAVRAGKKGFDTFGALLVHQGEILEEAENTADWNKEIFGHAEFNLVHQCANRYPDNVLKESTLYTSCAPCERCLCAIASLGIENVVFGVSYEAFSQLTPQDAVPLDREGLLRKLGIRMRLTGPVLEDEGMHVFEWWGGEYRPLAELISEMAEIRGRMTVIETERLLLRKYTPDDFDALYEIMSDPETMQHYPAPFDAEKTRRWIDWNLENYEKYGFGLWAVVLKETGGFIGDCGITIQNIDGEMLPEIGYHIHKKYWRRGYAKEAARAVRDWAFRHTPYDTVYSYMKYSNTASSSTAAANGMRKVKEYPDPKNTVSYAFAITRSEWEALKESKS